MKKLVTWAKANPFWATISGIALVAGIITLVWYLTKDNTPKAPSDPNNPNANKSGTDWVNPPIRSNIFSHSFIGTGVGTGGAGMSGGRMGHGKS